MRFNIRHTLSRIRPLWGVCFALTLTCCSCSEEVMHVTTGNSQDGEDSSEEAPSAYQDKIRMQPYPKETNELFVNPAPLIVPQHMKTDDCLQFNLSRSADFDTSETVLSDPQDACFYNPHYRLESGTWYWRFRSTNTDASRYGSWSDTYSFEVKEETPVFLTPPFSTFLENASRVHPRLYCFLNPRIDAAREQVASHAEYRQLIARAALALDTDYTAATGLYANAETLRQHATYLYHAYYLTQDEQYAVKLREMLRALLAVPPTDTELFSDNFTTTNITLAHAATYDLLYSRLTVDERNGAEELMLRVLRSTYQTNCGYQENHIFDNHFWQQNMRILTQTAFLLYDKPAYSAEVLPMLEYYYELWTARAPAGGFNRDGLWHNGTGYMSANVKTLAYIPALFSYVTRFDFLQHPWYQNAGRSLVYTIPPGSRSVGFGDASERYDEPNRLIAAFADYLARETGDGYAGWYAAECSSLVQQDYELRLYRMCADRNYNTTLPADAAKMVWYKDAGEVAMHSHLGDATQDLALAFRSSTFGSGSHTTASQNAFNLLYKGEDVYRSTGYYQSFADAHNLMSYRHTRAHNTLLVNGIGQPYSTEGYGNIVRALGGSHISYALGDASHAYCGISTDTMWINYFALAGIEQSAENGFGPTPLTKYRRHVLMLHPDIVLIYDELEASEAVRYDWLLHSPTVFSIGGDGDAMFSTENSAEGFVAVTQLYGAYDFSVSQTDRFVVPPAQTGPDYPNQWHLTAQTDGHASTRYLAIIQVKDAAAGETPVAVRRTGDDFTVDGWRIHVVLDAGAPACLTVTSDTDPVVFSYDTDNPVLEGEIYYRQSAGSSLLYDDTGNGYVVQEMTDRAAISTRAINH